MEDVVTKVRDQWCQASRRRLAGMVPPRNGWPGLTDCELEVVRQVARGLTNRQVAGRLFLSQHTVGNHLRHAFAKLDVTSRVELARLAAIHDNTAGSAGPAPTPRPARGALDKRAPSRSGRPLTGSAPQAHTAITGCSDCLSGVAGWVFDPG